MDDPIAGTRRQTGEYRSVWLNYLTGGGGGVDEGTHNCSSSRSGGGRGEGGVDDGNGNPISIKSRPTYTIVPFNTRFRKICPTFKPSSFFFLIIHRRRIVVSWLAVLLVLLRASLFSLPVMSRHVNLIRS